MWKPSVCELNNIRCSSARVNSDIMTVQALEAEDSVAPLSDIRITFNSLNTVSEVNIIRTCIEARQIIWITSTE